MDNFIIKFCNVIITILGGKTLRYTGTGSHFYSNPLRVRNKTAYFLYFWSMDFKVFLQTQLVSLCARLIMVFRPLIGIEKGVTIVQKTSMIEFATRNPAGLMSTLTYVYVAGRLALQSYHQSQTSFETANGPNDLQHHTCTNKLWLQYFGSHQTTIVHC